MDVLDAALHPGLRGLDEPVLLPGGEPASRVWTGDPSSSPLATDADEEALADAGAGLLLLCDVRLWDAELASLNPISQRVRAIYRELRAAIGA